MSGTSPARGDVSLEELSLLCSRVFHDLMGPVTAINNGLELMESAGDDPEIVELLRDSAEAAWTRLEYFRLVFGSGGRRDDWDLAELKPYAEKLLKRGSIQLQWQVPPGCRVPTMTARLILLMLFLLSETVHRGGRLALHMVAAGDMMMITGMAQGERVAFHPSVREALTSGQPTAQDEWSILPLYAFRLARASGLELTANAQDGRTELRAARSPAR